MKTYTYTSNNEKQPNKIKQWWKKIKRYPIFTWLFRLGAIGFLLLVIVFVGFSFTLPNPNKLLERNVVESTKIFDREGNILYEIHGEAKRTQVELDQISDTLKHATIAIEDKDFYKHAGISPRGLLRSIIIDIFAGRKEQGGSTITQQFVKNAVLTRDKSYIRKAKEIVLSLEIDARFSKDEILKLYLNEIPYGRNAYGIEAASQTYFGKHAKDLTVAESGYLAALPQAPTFYNPSGPNRKSLDNRQKRVLQAMKDQGYITDEEYNKALEEKVEFKEITTSIKAPHFVLYVQDYLANKYGEKTLEEGGLKVYTTLDSKLQDIAENAIKTGVEKDAKKYGANNAGLVAVDPKTGQILAMVGSKDYFGESLPAGCKPGKNCLFEPNVNVTLSERQPGSSFKPYAYVTAFKKEFKYSPASMLMDVTTDFGRFGNKDYVPHNYNGKNYGPVSMRQALAGSLNIPAVKTLALVGPDNVIQTARDLGITSPLQDCGLSLVLGGCEVKLLDHTASFAALANMGERHKQTPILKVLDRQDKVLEEYKDASEQVIDPQAVYELISIMTDNNARSYVFGTNSPLAFGDRQVACKTGTTNNWHDGWTMCFTPSISVGVWAGNNDGTLLKKGADGVYVAAPIVRQTLQEWFKDKPKEEFKTPEGIKRVVVDSVSGKLPTEYSPSTKTEIFADYAVPTTYDDIHIVTEIDASTGLPATPLTPPDLIALKPYTVFHSEKPNDPNWEGPVVVWARDNGYDYPLNEGTISSIPQNPGEGPNVDIVEPSDGGTINQIPFKVSVTVSSGTSISRVDLFIDGQFIQSLTSEPYIFQVTKKFPDGAHTLAVHAVDQSGHSSDTTSRITFAVDEPLTITDPLSSSTVESPVTLSAQSRLLFDTVSFYAIEGKKEKLIGTALASATPSGAYIYSTTWNGPQGKQTIYAKSNTGTSTNKLSFTIQ